MLKEIVTAFLLFLNTLLPWANLAPRNDLPCNEPLAYHVEHFDRRFGLSYKDFLSALSSAEAVWEKPLGRELFSYKPDSNDLEVNLFYDYRQETTRKLISINTEVKGETSEYRTLRAQYESLKSEHSALDSTYQSKLAAFNQKLDIYESHLKEWNEGPRTQRAFQGIQTARDSQAGRIPPQNGGWYGLLAGGAGLASGP